MHYTFVCEGSNPSECILHIFIKILFLYFSITIIDTLLLVIVGWWLIDDDYLMLIQIDILH